MVKPAALKCSGKMLLPLATRKPCLDLSSTEISFLGELSCPTAKRGSLFCDVERVGVAFGCVIGVSFCLSITFWSRLAVQSFSMVLIDKGALAFIYPCQWGSGEGWLTACERQTVMRVKEARHSRTNPLLELHWKAVKWQRGGYDDAQWSASLKTHSATEAFRIAAISF